MESKQVGDLCRTLYDLELVLLCTFQNLEVEELRMAAGLLQAGRVRLEKSIRALTNNSEEGDTTKTEL